MKDYKWRIDRFDNYIKLIKSRTNNYELEDLNIDFNEWDLYKITNRFKRIDESDIETYGGVLLVKKNNHHYIDQFIKWVNSNGLDIFTYLNMPIIFDPEDIKVIDESL